MQAKPFLGNSTPGYYISRDDALPYYDPRTLFTVNSSRCISPASSAKAAATGRLVGSTLPDDGSITAMLQDPGKDKQFQEIPSDFASAKEPSDVVYPSHFHGTMSLDPCLPIPKHDGFSFGPEGSGFAPHSDGEPSRAPRGEFSPEKWPYGYSLPISRLPAKDDHLQEIPLGFASPDCLAGLVHPSQNGNRLSSYPHIPLPENDGTTLGLHIPETALHEDGEQCRIADRSLEAEQGPSGSCVPLWYLPACRSNRRRKRRRFTNDEKAVIKHKRKVGVCGDCRQAKRKASSGITSAFLC